MAPLFICLKLTAPVLDDRLEVSWNKPLTLLQCIAIPWLWFLLLKQYDEPWFGESAESIGFPRYGCAFIGNIILVTIIALTTNLYHPPGIVSSGQVQSVRSWVKLDGLILKWTALIL